MLARNRIVQESKSKRTQIELLELEDSPNQKAQMEGLVPRYPLQKPPSRGLEGCGGEGGGGDEGLKVEGGFTFGRLQRGLKGASRGLEGGFKGA